MADFLFVEILHEFCSLFLRPEMMCQHGARKEIAGKNFWKTVKPCKWERRVFQNISN